MFRRWIGLCVDRGSGQSRTRSLLRQLLHANCIFATAIFHANMPMQSYGADDFQYDVPTGGGLEKLELSTIPTLAIPRKESINARPPGISASSPFTVAASSSDAASTSDGGDQEIDVPELPRDSASSSRVAGVVEPVSDLPHYVSIDSTDALPQPVIDNAVPRPAPVVVPAEPWWNTSIADKLSAASSQVQHLELEVVVWQALANSPSVQAILTEPMIREAEVLEASAIFDPTRFVDSIFHDTNDPVGNLLTTGGAPRLKEHFLESNLGVRGKNRYGGQTELSQGVDFRTNNSQFFVPNQQSDTKLALKYTHPFRKGAGEFYNRSSIAIAQVAVDLSRTDANLALQEHVFDVYQTYWTLFYQRSMLVQAQRAAERMRKIAETIEARADIDGTRSQASRARAAISAQEARTQRAAADLAKAEHRLRALVNAPELVSDYSAELSPATMPINELLESDLVNDLAKALETRPELQAIHHRLRVAHIEQQVAENELKPTLNLVTEAYVRGLNGDYAVADSIGDQFGTGRPSYSAGIQYARPKYNSAATAIRRQRNAQIRQLLYQLDQQLLEVSSEIRASAAEVTASFYEYSSAVQATLATNEELSYLVDRWKTNPILENTNPALLLDEILDAETRLLQSENGWALAQSNYMIALGKLQLACGTMLNVETIQPNLSQQDLTPTTSE